MTTSTNFTDILYRVEDGVAVVTLNRPDKLNAWRGEMDRDVRAAMRLASEDSDVRLIVLTGAGKGFCAGADMGLLQSIQSGAAGAASSERPRAAAGYEPWDPTARADFQKQYSWFPAVPKPIIAAINGACAGLGLVLSLYADIRFASDTAKFTTAFSKRGLVAEHGVSWLLPRLIGFAAAADLLYSSRVMTASEAQALGLVSRTSPAETFEHDVLAYAKALARDVSPRSLREMKRELWNAQLQPLGEAIEAANADMPASFQSEDFKEGVAHFVEKRAPRFTGR
ncbi:MAG: enoyl-CoA hydratase [Alphaproteobacteria bacterium]|nr:enoyl-CoA hydratase [Alphaproteobacteria bacterium]